MPSPSNSSSPGSGPGSEPGAGLLTPADVRMLANRLDIRPTKQRGQNFVIDQNTIRRIVRLAGVCPGEQVLEVGPGLGSLTLGLLAAGAQVTAIEVDKRLAEALPEIVAERLPDAAGRLAVISADALRVPLPLPKSATGEPCTPTKLVANLPYNVAVPILLRFLADQPSITRAVVMVQAEVARRLVAAPGGREYGIPSAKLAWFGSAGWLGSVPPSVFWPVPRVESALVEFDRVSSPTPEVERDEIFRCIDAAFAQRRKTIRRALSAWAGGGEVISDVLVRARVDPSVRAEVLSIREFARIAGARTPGSGA
ncbi:MAG: 16S rRNA (adenine(1518)-N(6)/adenine(1519)-N(6))-dimethyltransferase RsmA [Candidatus Nanopelagicales bacterium]|nr:16S rRNA (adenine(1518)-N(6)/adenine(1519)-N(6))-dimethyltransferase RsmA [Candidatus Nanopelagicales bacterium]